jgi:3-deoxy-D-manno-octulosonic-acid transferase
LIEAAAVGRPIMIGQSTYNFSEATKLARDADALEQVGGADQCMSTAAALLAQPVRRERMAEAGREFTSQHRGATTRSLEVIERLLNT